jgi:hypothetical protein
MSKYLLLSLSAALLTVSINAYTPQQRFERFKKIEAYEVRPGVLMLPRYSADNQVCEFGLQRLAYSQEMLRVDSDISSEINPLLDQLVPPEERGKPSNAVDGGLVVENGPILARTKDFENVTIQTYAGTFNCRHRREFAGQVVAVVKWKNRVCR